MTFSLSTRWNAYRHTSGETMIEEILAIGFDHVELGFDLALDLVPGVSKMVKEKTVTVDSVHNFCPIPAGAPYGHPELFPLTSLDSKTRKMAVLHTIKTINFAAEMNAKFVVAHAGHVDMKNLTSKLLCLCEQGKQYSPAYEKIKLKLFMQRDKKVRRHLDPLCNALEEILPVLQETNVRLALENLPSWEAIPSETEMEEIFKRFDSPAICYWHDIGHGQVRQNLGFISHKLWLEKLASHLGGMHIHDVAPPARDHLMPPNGNINFTSFKSFAESGIVLVFEPAPGTPGTEIREGMRIIREAWGAGS